VEPAGPFTMPFYQRNAPKGFRFDLIPPPVPDSLKGKPVYTYGDPKNIGIFSNSRNPQAAWEFAKFILSPQNDALFLKLTGQIPYRKDLLSNPAFRGIISADPYLKKFVEMVPRAVGVDDTPHLIEIYDAISRQYDAAVVQGRVSPEEGLKKAAQTARDVISGFR
jgi:multiple sugar transport system substrate-binding protein